MMSTKLIATPVSAIRALAGVAVALVVAGCGQGAAGNSVSIDDIDRPSGGTVECATSGAGGIDCNWEGR